MSRLVQGLKGIHHGQPRADNQYPGIHRQRTQSLDIPRVQRCRVEATGLALRRAGRREHAGGQDRNTGLPLATVLECGDNTLLRGLQIDHFITHMAQA